MSVDYVRAARCETCIFHPENRMHLRPGRLKSMTDETDRNDSNVICHESKGLTDKIGMEAYCHGSVERRPGQMIRIMERLGCLKEI